MKQYLELLSKILTEGVEKESGRANMPNTIGISKADISMNLSDGFPLLTTKKMFWKGMVHELLWFLRGETNIKYLVDNKVNIWNPDAYRWYLKYFKIWCPNDNDEPLTLEEFVDAIKNITPERLKDYWFTPEIDYCLGDLGKVYGAQWRNQNGVDQIMEVMEGLKNNPYSRYHIIDGWNKADFPEMALPPCHLLYQFIVRPLDMDERINLGNSNNDWYNEAKENDERGIPHNFEAMCNIHNIPKFYLDLNMYQRSCDTALGVPFNIASMSLLLMLVAKANGMIAGVANWIGGDTHLYVSHLDKAREQIEREPLQLPELKINKEIKCLDDILALTIDDFELVDYKSHDPIKFELFVGLKKK